MEDPVQILTPKFVDLELSTVYALDKGSVPSTPDTRIQRPKDGANWSAPNNIFGETIEVGVSESKSDYNYKQKTYFQAWKKKKEFKRQFFSRS